MRNIRFLLLSTLPLLCLLLIAAACRGKNGGAMQNVSAAKNTVPVCNADSLWHFVARQVAFGPRTPNSEAHRLCAGYLQAKLASYGASVRIQEFEARRWDNALLNGRNIMASFNPEQTRRILLCAHWDSRPYADRDTDPDVKRTPIDGANDGASGVAVLLEIARVMQQNPPLAGVDIVLFDLEDSGKPEWENHQAGDEYAWCLGAQHWAENPPVPGYSASYGILLDMVGTYDPCFAMEATSMYYAPDIMRKVWEKAALMGYGNIFQNRATGALIDDHLFVNDLARIPTIDIVHYDNRAQTGFFPHWHTLGDNLEHVSASTLKIVGDVVLATLYE
ncbi:MAG: M28 family peptidase [Bacteroidales bacterium]|nr:M28 family peptidase [Bacteroidales bacterium]